MTPPPSRVPPDTPYLAVVIPTLDEQRHIEPCVRSLLDDDYPRTKLELLIVDGGSTDATRQIAEALCDELPFVRLLDNPARLQAAAFNLAMHEADPRATCLLRCDAHAIYRPGFMTRAVETLVQTRAALVAFTDEPEAERPFQAAVAFAQSTPLGVGNAQYRLGNFSGWVDHGKHGCFARAAVEAVGGYDEGFSHNEDSELSLRLWEAGGGVWLDSDLIVGYRPRETPAALARQYFLYGRGRAATCLKHRIFPSPRQLLPPLLVLLNSALALGSLRHRKLLAPLAVYAASLCGFGAWSAATRRDPRILLSPLALTLMHHAWGAGFIARVAGRGAGLSKSFPRRRGR